MRILIALMLWIFVVPLATAYIYVGWLHSPSHVSQRLRLNLLLSDTISGGVIAGVVIISFLSLMSFADFLRFNIPNAAQNRVEQEEAVVVPPLERDIDEIVLDHHHIVRRQRNINAVGVMDQRHPVIAETRKPLLPENEVGERNNFDRLMQAIPIDPQDQRLVLQRRIRAAAAFQRHLDAIEHDELQGDNGNQHHDVPIPLQEIDEERIADFFNAIEDDPENEDEDPRFPPQDDFEPQFEPMIDQLDQGGLRDDGDMNLAMDELLGLRGPFSALIRNVLWFMAFVMTYLGIFAFVPRFIGHICYKRVFLSDRVISLKRWLWLDATLEAWEKPKFVISLLQLLHDENVRLERVIRINDLLLIILGYFSIAFFIALAALIVSIRKQYLNQNDEESQNIQNANAGDFLVGNVPLRRNEVDDENNFADEGFNEDGIVEIRLTLGQFLKIALDCLSSLAKVYFLFFVKMIVLPLILGIWLDTASLSAFHENASSRISYAGTDLFSAILIHWVIGITFMLLVTVSVLQLREVFHPELLAAVIRPQEPQPDLLGNLLNETFVTHTKRMVVSFGIYSLLLLLYVWIPCQLIVMLDIGTLFPFLRPKFFYFITPQLQIPIELLFFHLTMLNLLEKYRNSIGAVQHWWLAVICKALGLSEYLLPRNIKAFEFIGSKAIFIQGDLLEQDILDDLSDSTPSLTTSTASAGMQKEETKNGFYKITQSYKRIEVDPFWYELANKSQNIEDFIEKNIEIISPSDDQLLEEVLLKPNGKCTLNGCKDYIKVPLPSAEQDVVDRIRRRTSRITTSPQPTEKNMISTSIGSYRLRRSIDDDGTMVIEFWRESPGDVIPRPPHGWDDLGGGGAEAQGRWAWGKEKKSMIEEGVASRTPFFGKRRSRFLFWLIMKVFLLAFISWMAVTFLAITLFSFPLLIGRTTLSLLRIPDCYTHDPVAFATGLLILSTSKYIGFKEIFKDLKSIRKILKNINRSPSRKTTLIFLSLAMWFLVLPSLVGLMYDILIIKSFDPFSKKSFRNLTIYKSIWASGSLLLNLWAYLCYMSAFTKQFWINLRNAIFNEGVNLRNMQHEEQGVIEGDRRWQGSLDGRIARFFESLYKSLIKGEWDCVDPDVLFFYCTYPILHTLIVSICMPLLPCIAASAAYRILFKENLSLQILSLLVNVAYYLFMTLRICIIFSKEIKEWFKVAHKEARDDRYLIGNILLNYSPEEAMK
jgi:E3 ubiquitin-protein ligase MARCH6